MKGKEIAERIKEMMSNESLRVKVGETKEGARKACGVGGSCEVIIKRLMGNGRAMLKSPDFAYSQY